MRFIRKNFKCQKHQRIRRKFAQKPDKLVGGKNDQLEILKSLKHFQQETLLKDNER